ncbi:hypothetical protein HLB23_25075 [Nocardia uniformis]|uniref:Uncharacterized protein n=1 Tax=Nocardia uniformis TaxID=53432 RepID=A0A849C335_9NOCA|nr:NYN domain-containing protein [Nocardia uniformis]NNH73094.1 hypothetical protein [Nocardia uniformis]
MTGDKFRLIVVDGANVVGARPDGWWRDRAGAAHRLLERLSYWREALDQPADLVVVLEGAAKAAIAGATEFHGIRVVSAAGSGDDAIVEVVAETIARDNNLLITVVTADRGLRERVEQLGAVTVGPSWLLDRIES